MHRRRTRILQCLLLLAGLLVFNPANGDIRVLVDASRDGGAWWYPQGENSQSFDPALHHQGKPAADHLRSLGMRVTELPRPFNITRAMLNRYDLVIRAGSWGTYSDKETAAYLGWVEQGGALILLADHTNTRPGPEPLALAFGLHLEGTEYGMIESMPNHPITDQVTGFLFNAGAYLQSDPPEGMVELGYVDEQVVMGLLPWGMGQVFFMGDTNAFESLPPRLLDNLLDHFLSIHGLAEHFLWRRTIPVIIRPAWKPVMDAALAMPADTEPKQLLNQLELLIDMLFDMQQGNSLDPLLADALMGTGLRIINTLPDTPRQIAKSCAALRQFSAATGTTLPKNRLRCAGIRK